jgi:hypothetical protein
MGSEIKVNAGIAELTINLSEFTAAVGNLVGAAVGANEKEGARAAVKELITEVRKTFDTVVDTVSPLYEVQTEQAFIARFDSEYKSFKSLYLKRKGVARTHCHTVQEQFDKLDRRRDWMKNLPFAQRSYKSVKDLCERWLFNDWSIVQQIEAFFDGLNKFMDEIASLKRTNPPAGFRALANGLSLVEADFLRIKTQLDKLKALDGKL